jgi:hypothetical protein
MVRLVRTLSLLLIVLLAACNGAADEVGELPTLAVLPSLTPSNTPTITPTPTATASATPTPTPTATLTPTVTDTPTLTLTATPSITPTRTITPLPTATDTPTLTPTPTLTLTPVRPQIITFTASSDSAAVNGTITLRWEADADSARIDQLNVQGAVAQSFPVPPVGDLAVTVPATGGGQVIYRLVALRGGEQATRSVAISIQCQIPWFFGANPLAESCPTALGAVGPGAYQPFERGVMIYVNANGLNRIYGLQNDGNRYIAYTNGWDGSALNFDAAPSGLTQPQEMFRWAFLNTNAPVGTWLTAIGWATAAIDRNDRTIQFAENGAFYINTPSGVIRFSGGDSGTWRLVQ